MQVYPGPVCSLVFWIFSLNAVPVYFNLLLFPEFIQNVRLFPGKWLLEGLSTQSAPVLLDFHTNTLPSPVSWHRNTLSVGVALFDYLIVIHDLLVLFIFSITGTTTRSVFLLSMVYCHSIHYITEQLEIPHVLAFYSL